MASHSQLMHLEPNEQINLRHEVFLCSKSLLEIGEKLFVQERIV